MERYYFTCTASQSEKGDGSRLLALVASVCAENIS